MPTDRTLDGNEPIGHEETVFRRVLTGQYKPNKNYLSPQGFRPRNTDVTGISVCRAAYLNEPKPESAAGLGPEGMEF